MADFNALKDKLLAKLGQAAEATKDMAEKVADGAKDMADKAADTAKTGSRIAKLNIEIATERDNMKKTYLEIGKLYYDTHKDDPEGFFIQLCDEVALAEKNIAEKEAEIAELKESLKSEKEEDDSIEVEFEEIVEQEECAAECQCCCEKAEEVVEETAEAVEEVVEEVVEAVEEAVEDAVEEATEDAE